MVGLRSRSDPSQCIFHNLYYTCFHMRPEITSEMEYVRTSVIISFKFNLARINRDIITLIRIHPVVQYDGRVERLLFIFIAHYEGTVRLGDA